MLFEHQRQIGTKLVMPCYWRARGKASRSCEIITTLWENLVNCIGPQIALLIFSSFLQCRCDKTENTVSFSFNVFFFHLSWPNLYWLWYNANSPVGSWRYTTNSITFMKHATKFIDHIYFQEEANIETCS